MHIFKTKNLIIELGDWLANNSVKLGHISYIGASKELWFKFDIASLIIDKWERLLNVSWINYHIWNEVQFPSKKKNFIDMVIAPEIENNDKSFSINWKESGIIEFKTIGYPITKKKIQKPKIANIINSDFDKRKNLNFKEMIAITLCNHYFDEKEFQKEEDIIEVLNQNFCEIIEVMKKNGLRLPNNSNTLPYSKSSFRGENHGYHSCGVWIKD